MHATDVSNASRTLLFDIHTLAWDEDLLRLFDIPLALLAEVRPNSHLVGGAAHLGMEAKALLVDSTPG